MKIIALALLVLPAIALAADVALDEPQLLSPLLGRGSWVFGPTTIDRDAATGEVNGYHGDVMEVIRRAGSGRGGPTSYYTACDHVTWSADGRVTGQVEYFFAHPTRPVPHSQCGL